MTTRRFVVFWYAALFCILIFLSVPGKARAYQSAFSVKAKEMLKAIWQATPNFFSSKALFRVEGAPSNPLNTNTVKGGGIVLAGKFLLSARHVGIPSTTAFTVTPFGPRIMSYGEKIIEERMVQFNHYATNDMKVIYQSEVNDTVVLELAQECRACTTPIPFGFSKNLALGDTLVIVGNALLNGLSLRIGTVSAFHPDSMDPLSVLPSYVGTADFSICPGDSGYPIYALTPEDDFVIIGHAIAHAPLCRKGIFGLIDPTLADIQKETGLDLRALHNAYIALPASP